MNIWIFNNYNMLPEQGGLNRHYNFAKYLARLGHQATVFVGSHPHNTDLQMIEDNSPWKIGREREEKPKINVVAGTGIYPCQKRRVISSDCRIVVRPSLQ